MQLNAYIAEKRLNLYEDLQKNRPPREGSYDEQTLREATAKGHPQLGSMRYEPNAITFEFIYPDGSTGSTVFEVRIDSPERIVYMPVPPWVLESIWQGEIDGSYHFESDAHRLMTDYASLLSPEANTNLFGERQLPTGRG